MTKSRYGPATASLFGKPVLGIIHLDLIAGAAPVDTVIAPARGGVGGVTLGS